VCNHAPNKTNLYNSDGIPSLIKALTVYRDHSDIQFQGLMVLLAIISKDPYVKYSVAFARETVKSNGIVEIVYNAQQNFPEDQKLINMSNSFLTLAINSFAYI
jgi:hypothetical protein